MGVEGGGEGGVGTESGVGYVEVRSAGWVSSVINMGLPLSARVSLQQANPSGM